MIPQQRHSGRESVQLLLTTLATSLLLVLSLPGRFSWWPLLSVALVPLLFFVVKKGPWQSGLAGLVTGFFYHVGLLYWIVIVLGRYGGLPQPLAVAAMLLLSLYMGVYTGLFAALLSFLLSPGRTAARVPVRILFAAPVLWVGLDWLRGLLFSGFPWMDLGYGLSSQPVLIQIADLGGHHLVTFALVLVNGLVLFAVDMLLQAGAGKTSRKGWPVAGLTVVLLVLAAGYSVLRYQQVSRAAAVSPLLRVAVVQGNIPQNEKWTLARKRSTLDEYKQLSEESGGSSNASLVVWPETALPFFPVKDPLFATVTGWAAEKGIWLLSGAPYYVLQEDLDYSFKQAVSYYNSALLVDPSGRIAGRYDKQHLVPFGEYVPMRKLLPFLEPLVESVGNFSFGTSGEPLVIGTARAGVLICYESIFPGLAREEAAAGANVLVNITNDAWYGRTSAPYQSFAMSVFRAVETRRSLVRAANTGISGFVDPSGRVVKESPIFVSKALAASMPLVEERTIFVRFGHLFAPVCLFLFPFFFAGRQRRRR